MKKAIFFLLTLGAAFLCIDKERNPIFELDEEVGTIFCLEGDYRRAPFFHGVSKVKNRRISVTFRTTFCKSEKKRI